MIIDTTLEDICVVFTGKLPSGLTRKQATDLVSSHAGLVESGISEFTDYLVVPDKDTETDRVKKAKNVSKRRVRDKSGNPIKIITEDELWAMAETGKRI